MHQRRDSFAGVSGVASFSPVVILLCRSQHAASAIGITTTVIGDKFAPTSRRNLAKANDAYLCICTCFDYDGQVCMKNY